MIKLEHKKVGNYLMLTNKKVAQLKHSSVFWGLNVQNKKKVLIKVISRSQYESNDILMNSFNFQFNTMNLLKEQNILKAIELIITEKNYYLVLEEPQGESFKKILTKNGPLKEKDLINYLKKLRATFAALEKNNIIHGNINSKSVLIHHNQVKLGYPSYVKTIEILKNNSTMDQSFSMGENLEKQKDYSYLPPELLATGMISPKHDIWSLGVVVYDSLFGQLPWNIQCCNSPQQMASFIMNEKIKFPKKTPISKQMKHFILGCLEIDPSRRFGWEEALEHKVFTRNLKIIEQKYIEEEQVLHEEAHPFLWMKLDQQAKSNSTINQ